MARQKGTANFSGTLEVLAGGPIDSRTVVPTLADLTVASNFPYAYVGLETYVVSENKKYRLIAADVTQSSNWEEVGSGGDIDVDDALSSTSENPVQNKVVKAALDSKVNAVNGKGLSTNDYTTSEKDKLAGLSNYDDTALRGLIAGKQDALTAGNGIDITNNVISAGIPIVSNQFDKANIYSTTEKVVGMWIDGKPLYQKVVSCGKLPTSDEKQKVINHGISNVDNIFIVKGFAPDGSGKSLCIPVVSQYDSSKSINPIEYTVAATVDRTSITFTIGKNGSLGEYYPTSYVVLQYTKTTDAVNSFNYADENDYSTTEHIVGSWIDGKPIYQKTVSFGALPKNTTKEVSHGISYLKRAIKVSGYTYYSSDGSCFPIPYSAAAANISIELSVTPTKISITTATDWSALTECYVTLQYTKTTD